MPVIYSPDGRPYRTDSPTEIIRLTMSEGYRHARPFVPDEHTVPEVLEHVEEHPAEAPAVVAAERRGKARKSIVGDPAASEGNA